MRWFLVTLIFLLSDFIYSQDVHFSQLDKTNSLLNPSLISIQNDDYELQLHRRSQWSSVTTPFNTFAVSFNLKDIFKRFSLGFTILSDIAGDSYFSTDGLCVSVAKSINNRRSVISLGVQASSYQRAVNFNNLIFLENENLQNKKFTFLDISLGLSSYTIINSSSSILFSMSTYHLNNPNQTLLSNAQVFLPQKHIIMTTYSSKLTHDIIIHPTIFTSSQRQNKELILGCGISYILNKDINLKSGFYNRFNDAFFVTLGMQKDNIDVLFSYDVNTSTLSNASNAYGAFEFSVTYGWSIFNEINAPTNIICPRYL